MHALNDKVLVTGAKGFIGGHIVQRMVHDARLRPIAASRDGRDGTLAMDLRDDESVRRGMDGMSAVIHCAVGDAAVTVDGTRRLLRAAADAGVRRVVYFSSIAVYGHVTGPVHEDAPVVSPDGSGYAAWKVAAENICAAEKGVETVLLRPSIVYGRGSKQWTDRFVRRIRSGRWGVFGTAGEGTCNPVHVRDVAIAAVTALTAPGASGRAFNVNGPEVTTWNDWFSRMAKAIDAPPLRAIQPMTMRRRAYAAMPVRVLAKFRPGLAQEFLLLTPGRSELALFAQRATYPTDAARAVMNWTPTVGITEGLAESVAGV